MPLPNLPLVVQVNWTQASAWSPWEQPHANILCEHAGEPTLLDVQTRRGILYPVISADTAVIRSRDPDWHVVPDKADSALYPQPLVGSPLRILEQQGLGSDVWVPKFFGQITRVEPDAVEVPRSRSTVQITAESPLRYLGAQNVTPAALPAGAPIYDPAATSALENLLRAAGLWGTVLLDLEMPATVTSLPGDWGGQPAQLGQGLVDLAYLAHTAVRVYPLYATAAGEPDWRLKWWRPRFETPLLTLHAPLGDLWATPTVQWGAAEVP